MWKKKKDKILGGKPQRKKPLGKRRRGCEDNIKMDFTRLAMSVWCGLGSISLGQGRIKGFRRHGDGRWAFLSMQGVEYSTGSTGETT
jgi:hypothetical protein